MAKKKDIKRSKPAKKSPQNIFNITIQRIVILGALILVGLGLFLFFVSKTDQWYFAISGKEQVDFAKMTGALDQEADVAYYENQTIPLPPPQQLLGYIPDFPRNVLGDATGANKRIEVDLANQRLYAFEGNTKVYDFLVSTGKYGKTPTGTFKIWIKLPAVLMKGGSKALGTYYYLPNVPWTMFFSNSEVPSWKGFGIHGTYWHSNFGHPMSHGCVNMKTEEAAIIYQWVQPSGSGSIRATADNPGTQVTIYGVAPSS